jgi:hypothetical protein
MDKPFYKYLGRDPHYKLPYKPLWFVVVLGPVQLLVFL